jgi:hypothetical protein
MSGKKEIELVTVLMCTICGRTLGTKHADWCYDEREEK